jgi:hypothetical protein
MRDMYLKKLKENKKKALSITKKLRKYNVDENLIDEIKYFIRDLADDLYEYQYITVLEYERPYAKKYLKEQRKKWVLENPERAKKGESLCCPDSDQIYKDYYDLRKKIK